MNYREFVKQNYGQFMHLAPKQRMSAVAKLWRESGHANNAVKPKATRGRGRPRKHSAKGAGIFGDVGNAVDSVGHLFGLGLEKKHRGRPRKSIKGGSVQQLPHDRFYERHGYYPLWYFIRELHMNYDDAMVAFNNQQGVRNVINNGGIVDTGDPADYGAGLEKKHRGRGRPRKHASGAGIFGDVGNVVDNVGHLFGLGLPEEKHEKMEGGSILGDIIPFGNLLGLGLKKGKKHHKRDLEKLELIKHMEGKGIFDDILDGVKKGVQTVADVAPAGISLYKTLKGGDIIDYINDGIKNKLNDLKNGTADMIARSAKTFGKIMSDYDSDMKGKGLKKGKKHHKRVKGGDLGDVLKSAVPFLPFLL